MKKLITIILTLLLVTGSVWAKGGVPFTGSMNATDVLYTPTAPYVGKTVQAAIDELLASVTASGTGDVTSVGDCTTGACFDGTSDGGSSITMYGGNLTKKTQLIAYNTAADAVVTLPTATASLATLELAETISGIKTHSAGMVLDDGVTLSPTLTFTDSDDETAVFQKTQGAAGSGYLTLTTAAADGLNILVGSLKIGNGTPAQTINGEDLYVEGLAEVGGILYADAAIIGSSTISATTSFLPVTADGATVGDADHEIKDVFIADGGVIYFQNDQSVYLTPSAALLTLTGGFTSSATITSSGIFDVTGAAQMVLGSTDVTSIKLLTSEDVVITPGSNTMTFDSTTSAVFIFTPATTITGALTANGGITVPNGKLVNLSGITQSAATDEGLALPTWADVSPTTDIPFISFDPATDALKVWHTSGWVTIGAGEGGGAPVDAKYLLVGGANDGTLTKDRYLIAGVGLAGTDTGDNGNYSLAFDSTELTNLTWSAGGSATIVQTYNVSTGTDPVITFGNNYVNVSTGALQAGGYVVYTTNDVAIVTSLISDSGTATATNHASTIAGGEGIDTTATGTTVTIAGEDASSSNKGIATFNTADFSVTSGDVTVVSGMTRDTEWDSSAEILAAVSDETGSGSGTPLLVFNQHPTLVTPILGAATATTINKVTITDPGTSATLTIANGASLITAGAYAVTITATGTTGVTLPLAGTLTSTSDKLSAFAATSSAELDGVISDDTGSGALVFATSPTLVTPVLGVATATSINKVAITAPATASTLTIADGSSLITAGAYAITLTATNTTGITLPTSGTLTTTSNNLSAFAATTSAQLGGVLSDETGYSSGALAVFSISPTLTTPVLGAATFTTLLQTGQTLGSNIIKTAGFSVDATGNVTGLSFVTPQTAATAGQLIMFAAEAVPSGSYTFFQGPTAAPTGGAYGFQTATTLPTAGQSFKFGTVTSRIVPLGYTTYLELSGGTMAVASKLTTAASAAATGAGFNIPSGVAPSSPVEGDFYYDGTHLYFYTTGAIDILAGGGATLTNLSNPTATKSFAMGAYGLTFTSATATWDGVNIAQTNSNPSAGGLLTLDYTANGDAQTMFILCRDNSAAETKFSVGQDGNTTVAGTLGVTGVATLSTSAVSPLFTNAAALAITTTASNGSISITPNGTGPVILTSGATTGSAATAGFQQVYNSLTTGNGLDISSSSLTTGNLVSIAASGTAAGSNTKTALRVATSGTNGTSTQTTYGAIIGNTSTGTGSTNIGLDVSASGGATNNIALQANGNVSIVSGTFGLTGNKSIPAWTTSGARFRNVAGTLTDTSSSGTVAAAYTNVYGGCTIAASSATVYTDYINTAFNAPVVGSGVTFTRAHSVGIIDATSAASSITGGLVVAATLGTAATSVGIGGGNINAGGTIISGGTITSSGAFDVTGATQLTLGSADVPSVKMLAGAEDLVFTGTNDVFTISSTTGALLTITPDTTITGDLTVTGTDIQLGATGVKISSDNDGAITLLGCSAGFDESITLNMDDVDNEITVTSTATQINFSALNLVTTGTIQGAVATVKDDDTLAADQCYGLADWLSGGAETVTLPAAVVGMNILVYASDATVKNIDPNGTDTIVLTTAALTAGYQIESPGAAGDFIALVCFTANQWTCMGRSGVWVTHGAD